MALKSDRVESRLSPDQRTLIELAAGFTGESLSSFMVIAAVRRAGEVISERSATVVPPDYFDRLLAELDDEPGNAPRLTKAASDARRRRRIRVT